MRSLLTCTLLAAATPAGAQVFDDLILPPHLPVFDYQMRCALASHGEWAVLGFDRSGENMATLHRWDPAAARWELEMELVPSAGPLENLGYSQLNTLWRVRGLLTALRGKGGWGVMTRKGFESS